jgi:hypothetical protein
LPYNFDVNTGNGSYPADMSIYLNEYTFSGDNKVVVLYAKYRVHQNIITIWQNGIKAGAMLIDTGSMFHEPTVLYPYDGDNVDISTSFAFAPYKDDSSLPLNQTY